MLIISSSKFNSKLKTKLVLDKWHWEKWSIGCNDIDNKVSGQLTKFHFSLGHFTQCHYNQPTILINDRNWYDTIWTQHRILFRNTVGGGGGGGGEELYTHTDFFVQSFFADLNIHRRGSWVVSFESPSSVDYIKKSFFKYCFINRVIEI